MEAAKALPDVPNTAPAALAKQLGVKLQTLQNWPKRGVSGRGALAAQQRLRINTNWVMHGTLPMILASATALPASEPLADGWRNPIDLHNSPDYPAIRRVRFKLSAGASGFGVEYMTDEGAPLVFSRDWFVSRGYRPDKLFAVKVRNDSMAPRINDGDTVVVNTAQTEAKDGVVYAVNYEGELVIKRLVRDGGQWWLSSDNPDQIRYPRKLAHDSSLLIGEIVHKQSERI